MSVTVEGAKQRFARCRKLERTYEDNQQMYDEWSSTYDEDHILLQCEGPKILAMDVANMYPFNKKNIAILDVACGTGSVGAELHLRGFEIIDGLDPNEKMMKHAKEKNIYRNHFIEAIPEEGQTSIAEDTYDVVTVHGGFGSGALPVSTLTEMLRVAKQGGHVVIATIPDYFEYPQYVNKLGPEMAYLESTKRWEKIKEENIDNFVVSTTTHGILFIYKKL